MSDREEERTTEEVEKPFAIERAKTGRAKCKKCKCPIDKDAIRIAKLMTNPFGEGKMKAWHHVSCLFEVFAKQRAKTKRIDDPEEDISGWTDLADEDKRIILERIEEFENSAPFQNAKPTKTPKKESSSTPKKAKSVEKKTSSKLQEKKKNDTKEELAPTPSNATSTTVSKDDLFREFRRICAELADVSAYTEKTAIVKKMLTQGTSGNGFQGDIVLWCKFLLPGVVKRIYNLQSKQLVKLFARILCEDENTMLEDLEQGDVADTIHTFFEKSVAIKPSSKSTLTIQDVDEFLETLSTLTKEDEQIQHFKSIIELCTSNDLKMIIRLIKHDLRINAGPKHILQAIDEDAYAAFQLSRDLNAVLQRCLQISPSPSSSSSTAKSSQVENKNTKLTLTLMTPVSPMLAEACKSVDMAIKKCPYGMLAEVKYDGERVQVHKKGNNFNYFSRSLKPVLPHKVNLFKEYIPKAFPHADDLILDSEVLLIDTTTGKPLPFGSLGIHKEAEFKDANVCLFVFDCLYYNGESLMNKSMKQRRDILKSEIIEIPNRIMLSEVQEVHSKEDLAQMITKVLKMRLEGLVLKDVTGKYEPGKRHWLKVKKDYLFGGAMADTADLVVLGAWYGTGNKGGLMSIFLMGCYDEEHDRWLTVTKVSSGHDEATLNALQEELEPKMIKIGKDPCKLPNWLKANKPMVPDFVAKDPKVQPVWEITGAEFTNQGVHTADGISIRFPRVTRIRHDKNWSTATSLKELHVLFNKSADSIDFTLLLGDDKSTESTNRKRKRPNTHEALKLDINNGQSSTSSSSSNSKKEFNHETIMNPTKMETDDENPKDQPEYYAFVNKDYIEYNSKGEPLNWIEGRKPEKGLPSNAKPLSMLGNQDIFKHNDKSIFKNIQAYLSHDLKKKKRNYVWRTLKTLGASVVENNDVSRCTHVIHDIKEIPSTSLDEFDEFPKKAKHVNVSWVDASAKNSILEEIDPHAIQIVGDYCRCSCPHR